MGRLARLSRADPVGVGGRFFEEDLFVGVETALVEVRSEQVERLSGWRGVSSCVSILSLFPLALLVTQVDDTVIFFFVTRVDIQFHLRLHFIY